MLLVAHPGWRNPHRHQRPNRVKWVMCREKDNLEEENENATGSSTFD